MSSLATLIKLEKARVDDQRLLLARLQDVLARIEGEIESLIAARLNEEALAQRLPVGERVTLAPFLAQVKLRLEQLTKAKAEAEAAIAEARERLAECFETQKRYEIIRDRQAAEAAAAEKREEQLMLDELAGQQHERKQE